MTELKPCPACGSKIATPVLEYDVKFPQLGYVRCREITCGLKTGLFADGGRHAVEIWNSLPRPDEVRGVGNWIPLDYSDEAYGNMYKCAKCGCSEIGEPNYCPSCGAKMEVSEDA